MLSWRRKRRVTLVSGGPIGHIQDLAHIKIIPFLQKYPPLVQIDLDQVRADSLKSNRQHQLVDLIHHFGIYKDLFGAAYFVPRVPLDIQVGN